MKVKQWVKKWPIKEIAQKSMGHYFFFPVIHFGICTCTPMIFEGNPGQGKQAAIEYVCKDLLVYEIEIL